MISSAGVKAFALGRKLGTGRQNSNRARTGFSTAQRTVARRPANTAASPGSAVAMAARRAARFCSCPRRNNASYTASRDGKYLYSEGRLDRHAPGQGRHGQARHPVLRHHLEGPVECLLDGLLTPPGPSVRPDRAISHRSLLSKADHPGVVLVAEASDEQAVRTALDGLPLVEQGVTTFSVTEILAV